MQNETHIDELPAPTWVKENTVSKCTNCSTAFGFFTRKHHCRGCGNIFCYNCVQYYVTLPTWFGYTDSQRTCEKCFKKFTNIDPNILKLKTRKQIKRDVIVLKDVLFAPTKEEVSLVQTEEQRYELSKLGKEVLGKVQIIIIKAKDLMPKDDLTKTSDPYVTIRPGELVRSSDIRKTKVIRSNLNPEWNEAFTFNILGETKFILVGYDEDLIKSDDPLGRCEIDIDENWIVKENYGEEYWIKLQQGDLGAPIADDFITDSYDSPSTGPVTSGELYIRVLWMRTCDEETLNLYKNHKDVDKRHAARQLGNATSMGNLFRTNSDM